MAATVKLDLIQGNRGRKSDKGWEHLTRMAFVEGLSSGNGYERIHEAVLALYSIHGITIGTVHPAEPTAFVRYITPETISPTQIVLKITDKGYAFQTPVINIGGTVQQEQTNQDWDGNDIELEYTYPQNYPEQDRAGSTEKTGASISVLSPRTSIHVKRQELFDLDGTTPITYKIILARSKLFQGTVNHGVWNVDPDAAVETWICTQLAGVSIDGGFSFTVSYSFIHNAKGWRSHVVFIDPNTGKPAKDLITEEDSAAGPQEPPEDILPISDRRVFIYPNNNFNDLKI